jgi:hypothetical protein
MESDHKVVLRAGPYFLAHTLYTLRFWIGRTNGDGSFSIVWGRR